MTVQVLQPLGYSLKELAWRLSTVRKRRVPDRTLRWWIEQLHMEPNEYGLYDDSDLATLISLVLFLKRCRSLTKFKQLLIQEMEAHADEHRSPQEFHEQQAPRTAQPEAKTAAS